MPDTLRSTSSPRTVDGRASQRAAHPAQKTRAARVLVVFGKEWDRGAFAP